MLDNLLLPPRYMHLFIGVEAYLSPMGITSTLREHILHSVVDVYPNIRNNSTQPGSFADKSCNVSLFS